MMRNIDCEKNLRAMLRCTLGLSATVSVATSLVAHGISWTNHRRLMFMGEMPRFAPNVTAAYRLHFSQYGQTGAIDLGGEGTSHAKSCGFVIVVDDPYTIFWRPSEKYRSAPLTARRLESLKLGTARVCVAVADHDDNKSHFGVYVCSRDLTMFEFIRRSAGARGVFERSRTILTFVHGEHQSDMFEL